VDTRATERAAKASKLVGVDTASDVTGALATPATEKSVTVSVTKVVRKDVTKKPVQQIHVEGVLHKLLDLHKV
jgi:hypothetical protein